MRQGYIYLITNDINKKVYVGQTSRDIQTRFHEHCFESRGHSLLHKDIQKYGREHFSVKELEKVDLDKLDEREKYWIEFYHSFSTGYNQTLGGRDRIIDFNQILIVENNIIVESKEYLSKKISELTSWNLRTISARLAKIINTEKDFCGYHFISTKAEMTDWADESTLEDWIKKLNIIYCGKHIFCNELELEFSTIAEAAKYFIDNNYYTGTSVTPIQSIVTSIGKNLHGKSSGVSCIGGYTFCFMPGTTKNKSSNESFSKKKIYCNEINKSFDSITEAAKYFIDNNIWTGIVLKTANSRISDVCRGYFPEYKGYTFKYIE